jgi:hypothetical protein
MTVSISKSKICSETSNDPRKHAVIPRGEALLPVYQAGASVSCSSFSGVRLAFSWGRNFLGLFLVKTPLQIKMLATLSNENRILTISRSLELPADNLCETAKQLNIKISRGGLSEALNGKKPLDHNVAERLLRLLDEMSQLQQAVCVAAGCSSIGINWARVDAVTTALIARRLAAIAEEQSDNRFEQIAKSATQSVVK